MTVTENDRIRLLKVIQKETVDDCNMMIISKLAYVVVSACTMFCIVGTAHIPLLSTPSFLALFTRILTKYIEKFLVLPLSSYLFPLLYLPSEEVKSAIGATFSCS